MYDQTNFKQLYGEDETYSLDHQNELFKLAAK